MHGHDERRAIGGRRERPAQSLQLAQGAARWDAFVLGSPQATFFHRAGWQKVLGSVFRHDTHYLFAVTDNRITGLACANQELLKEFDAYVHTDENSNRVGEFAIGTNLALVSFVLCALALSGFAAASRRALASASSSSGFAAAVISGPSPSGTRPRNPGPSP